MESVDLVTELSELLSIYGISLDTPVSEALELILEYSLEDE